MARAAAVVDAESWVPVVGFGDRLRIVRRAKHRTQDEMASLLGVKKVTYASWEAGIATPPYAEVVNVARHLHLLDRVPEWWTLGAQEPSSYHHPEQRGQSGGRAAANLAEGTRSSTDRASDYGSGSGHFSPFRRDRRRRYLSVVPLRLTADDIPA